ncbi:MAG: fatty acid--CoA ligase family protein [Pseudomonadota bacterium]|nr:fatty acid--CoA ligase family protein [Pseudomonadota bacterium]
MQTVFGARLRHHASNARASPALAMPGCEVTYAELLGRVQRCSAWLAHERYLPSEVVGITIADEIPHLVASLALLSLGVPHVCLPTHDPVSMRLHLAERLAVDHVVVVDPQHALPGRKALLLTPELFESAASNALPDAFLADPDAPAIYSTSSGTTGEPKIFALSQHALAWRAGRMAESERIGSRFRALTPVPIEDSIAKNRRLTSTYLGFTNVFPNGRSSPPSSLRELCASLHVTCLELSALQVSSLVLDAGDPRPLPSHTTVYTAGSTVPARLRQQFKSRFGVPLFIHYGAREFGRITSTFLGGDDDDVETVGIPVPWIDLEIVDGDGKALPPGKIGEVRVRSECMTREYYRDPVATSRHLRDGWFYPRDLASLTRGGALCLHGRADDMMNLNGIKIFPAEIERVLEEHPAVKAAAAFAKSSATHGDIPVAAVELHASAAVGVDELMACARGRLGVRAPRKIFVLDALPRNAAGKIVKRELAGLIAPDK